MLQPTDLFDLSQTEHAELFRDCEHPWDPLKRLESYLARKLQPQLRNRCVGVAWIGENVSIGEGTIVEDGAMIKGPAVIGRDCEIRHNAYIRGNVIVGDGCVIGNACEIKHAILFNECEVPHFNYVGDSILGYRAHLGAGVKIANLKLAQGTVRLCVGNMFIDSGLSKIGALIGDGAQIGCNAVLSPGSIIGRGAMVYPNVLWRGFLATNAIAKNRGGVDVIAQAPPEGKTHA